MSSSESARQDVGAEISRYYRCLVKAEGGIAFYLRYALSLDATFTISAETIQAKLGFKVALGRGAEELGVREAQVTAAVDLLDGGATVPFVVRYRKEATGSLDDAQLRRLEERLGYLRDLQDRRRIVVESLRSQCLSGNKLNFLSRL